MINSVLPRGLRNNNPLNIRFNNLNKWKGQLGRDDKGFVKFSSLDYGVLASMKLMRTYNLRYKLPNLASIVSRIAPPSENNTERYVHSVSVITGFLPFEHLDFGQILDVLAACFVVENGYYEFDGNVFVHCQRQSDSYVFWKNFISSIYKSFLDYE